MNNNKKGKITMKIHTIEYKTTGKNKDQLLNEDGLIIKDNFIAVIDDGTSKSSISFLGHSSGCFAKDILKFHSNKVDISLHTPESFFLFLNNALKEEVHHIFPDLLPKDFPRV